MLENNMKRIFWVMCLALTVATLVSGCNQNQSSPPPADTNAPASTNK